MQDKLFEYLFVRSMIYADVAAELNIEIQNVRNYYNRTSQIRKDDIAKLRRIRSLYDNKKKIEKFTWKGFPEFYHWYVEQERMQDCRCYYCKSEEHKIRGLVLSGFFGKSKQMKNRGRHLEIERKNSEVNDYSPDNCVLACYFCNNDKSDVISEEDYFQYFVARDPSNRKRFIDEKYEELLKRSTGKE